MKKLFIVISFVIFSFFLISKNVFAETFEYELDFSLINEEFFKIKELADTFIKEDESFSDHYVIINENGKFYVSFFPINYLSSRYNLYISGTNFYFFTGSGGMSRYMVSSGSLSPAGSFSSNYLSPYVEINILYFNFDMYFRDDTEHVIIYKYDGWSTQDKVRKDEVFNTLYSNYLEYQSSLSGGVDHSSEVEKVNSFYTLVLDRLLYLCNVFVNNYIYLSIIVVFILVFVFKLFFRRHL